MKFLILMAAVMFSSTYAYSSELSCYAKYFNGQELAVVASAEIQSETSLQNFTLSIEKEIARQDESLDGRLWSGRKYKNMVLFDLDKNVDHDNGWSDNSMELMLPQGFSTLARGAKFKAMITTQASDGGSYNQIFCRID